jgi:hypothetical protein
VAFDFQFFGAGFGAFSGGKGPQAVLGREFTHDVAVFIGFGGGDRRRRGAGS